MEEIKKLLTKDVGYLPEGGGVDRLLSLGQCHKWPGKKIITEAGQYDANVYIVKSGVIRFYDVIAGKERTYAFGIPGDFFMSKYSFVKGLGSYYNVQTCCPSEIVCISNKDFWREVESDHQLALWMLRNAYDELFYQEYKNSNVHKGTARERLVAILSDRPMLVERVPQRMLASYLGITPEYFSTLKRDVLKNGV